MNTMNRLKKKLLSKAGLRAVISIIVFLVLWEIGARSKQWLGVSLPWIGKIPAPTAVLDVWAGLVGTVQALINSGAFGLRFPERCPDGQAICGCDSAAIAASVIAEMPGLAWPLETTCVEEGGFLSQRQPFAPDTLLILDFIEFIK